jgi:phosphoheptose isomerase
MKKFPTQKYFNLTKFSKDYFYLLKKQFDEIDYKELSSSANLVEKTIKKGRNIFLCGNGGSAAISNHFICDAFKNLRIGTNLTPKVYSLNSNSELISAISNDIGYDKVFVFQLESLFKKDDVLIAISSSGNSSNIINAAQFAKKKQGKVIGISGFEGGKLKKISNYSLHANIINYGISEDFAHSLMHVIIQFLIQKNLKDKKISDCVF